MRMRTMILPGNLLVLSALLVAPAARAQTTPAPAAPADTTPAPAAAPAAEPPAPPPAPAHSWFWRPNLEFTSGSGDSKWIAQLYGFAEFDSINDSTRSYTEAVGGGLIARDNTWAGQHSRLQFTARNSRIGFKVTGPTLDAIKPSAVIEVDFMANPGNYSGASSGSSSAGGTAAAAAPPIASSTSLSEASFYNNGVFRVRQAYVKLEDDVISVLAGQAPNVVAFQPYFFPASNEFFGVPGQAFGRTTQFRLWHTFKTDPINVDFVVAAMRPPQRDATLPGGEGGLMFKVNHWKALHTIGPGTTAADGAAIGVSGAVRKFSLDNFAPKPTGQVNDTGWMVSLDALLPIIPVANSDDRANALTLTGSFTTGSGDGDILNGMTSGIGNAALPNPLVPVNAMTGMCPAGTVASATAMGMCTTTPAPAYSPNMDGGDVVFTRDGTLHTIDWRTFTVGAQYYLPPSGRLFVSVMYSQGDAGNVASLATGTGTANTNYITKTQYMDATLLFDITPNVRTTLGEQYTVQTYGDGQTPKNLRTFFGAYFFF